MGDSWNGVRTIHNNEEGKLDMKIPPFPMNEREIYRTVKDTLANNVKLEPVCKNCQHWFTFIADNQWGVCMKINHIHEQTLPSDDRMAFTSAHDPCKRDM